MFADYRVPTVLLSLGVLEYSPALHTSLTEREIIQSGSEQELEIRGCSIWAVEVSLLPLLIY